MGLDDFDSADPEEAAELQRWLTEGDEDDDLFSFPDLNGVSTLVESLVSDGGNQEAVEQELADALEIAGELAADTAAELGVDDASVAPVAEQPKPAAPTLDPTGSFDLDEDLFDFDDLQGGSKVTEKLTQDLDSVFEEEELPFADANSQAIDELLGSLDEEESASFATDLDAITSGPSASAVDSLLDDTAGSIGALSDAELDAYEQSLDDGVEIMAPQSHAPIPPPAPVQRQAPAAPAPTPKPAAPAAEARPLQAATEVSEPAGQLSLVETAASAARSGSRNVWMLVLFLAMNALGLAVFWNSMSGMRDMVVETVQKIASAGPSTESLDLRQTFAAPVYRPEPQTREVLPWDAGPLDRVPDKRKLPFERFLEAGQWSIAEGAYSQARTELYQLLAQVDAVDIQYRDHAEAKANFLIAESYRLESGAVAQGSAP